MCPFANSCQLVGANHVVCILFASELGEKSRRNPRCKHPELHITVLKIPCEKPFLPSHRHTMGFLAGNGFKEVRAMLSIAS